MSCSLPISSVASYFSSFFSQPEGPQELSQRQNDQLTGAIGVFKQLLRGSIETLRLMLLEKHGEAHLKSAIQDIEKRLQEKKEVMFLDVAKAGHQTTLSTAQLALAAQKLDPEIADLQAELTKLLKQLKYVNKLSEIAFPKELVFSHLDFVAFIFDSNLAYSMACFKNSTATGPENHTIRMVDGEPCIKMNGAFTPWSAIKEQVVYDTAQENIVSIQDRTKGWNYISPDGLVQKERFEYKELYPVEQLGQDDYQGLLEHAKQFYSGNNDPEPGVEKTCIFQVVTTCRKGFWKVPVEETWLTKNLLAHIPRHLTLRMIDKVGRVYSFGVEPKKESVWAILDAFPLAILKTTVTKIGVPDMEETKECENRLVTSIALSEGKAQEFLTRVNDYNRRGFRFNFMKQNCTKLGSDLLSRIGVVVNMQISFGELLTKIGPDLRDIPYIGAPLTFLIEKVQQIVSFVWDTLSSILPSPIMGLVSMGVAMFKNALHKIATVFTNCLVYMLGGGLMTSEPVAGEEEVREHSDRVISFSRPVRGLGDLLRDDTCDINYSQKMVDWQNKQPSTVTHKYRGPKLAVVP